jgi:hypothetical protein
MVSDGAKISKSPYASIVIGVPPSPDCIFVGLAVLGAGHGVVDNHAYAVLGLPQGSVHLRNPWGGPGAELRLSLGNFRAAFQAVWQSA